MQDNTTNDSESEPRKRQRPVNDKETAQPAPDGRKGKRQRTAENPKAASVPAEYPLASIDMLPDETLLQILSYLPQELVSVYRTVCWRWLRCLEPWVPPSRRPNREALHHKLMETRRAPVSWAIRHNRFKLFRWLMSNPANATLRWWDGRAPCGWTRLICRKGRHAMLRWLMANFHKNNRPTWVGHAHMEAAAQSGSHETLLTVARHSTFATDVGIVYATYLGGNPESVRWAREHMTDRYCFDHDAAMRRASEGGHKHLIKALIKEFETDNNPIKCSISSAVTTNAVRAGGLDLVRWLVEKKGARYDRRVFDLALNRHDLPLMDWYVKHIVKARALTYDDTVPAYECIRNRHMETLEWLWAHNMFRVTNRSLDHAIQGKDDDAATMQWLKEHVAPPHTAAQYLVPPHATNKTIARAIRCRSEASLVWLCENCSMLIPGPGDSPSKAVLEAVQEAVMAKACGILRCVHRRGIADLRWARVLDSDGSIELHNRCQHPLICTQRLARTVQPRRPVGKGPWKPPESWTYLIPRDKKSLADTLMDARQEDQHEPPAPMAADANLEPRPEQSSDQDDDSDAEPEIELDTTELEAVDAEDRKALMECPAGYR